MCKERPPPCCYVRVPAYIGQEPKPIKVIEIFFLLSSVEFGWAQQVKDFLTEMKDSLQTLPTLDGDQQKKGIVKFYH